MSQGNDSPERIAADILIAMINNGTIDANKRVARPDEAVVAYKKIFKAVHHARTDAEEE